MWRAAGGSSIYPADTLSCDLIENRPLEFQPILILISSPVQDWPPPATSADLRGFGLRRPSRTQPASHYWSIKRPPHVASRHHVQQHTQAGREEGRRVCTAIRGRKEQSTNTVLMYLFRFSSISVLLWFTYTTYICTQIFVHYTAYMKRSSISIQCCWDYSIIVLLKK